MDITECPNQIVTILRAQCYAAKRISLDGYGRGQRRHVHCSIVSRKAAA
jgi:hypothetical protein